ncbi:methionine--tRNA ligase [Pseudoscourfieldia marina]
MPPQLAAERALGLLDAILANLSSTASSQQAANLKANLKARSQLAQPNGSKKKGSEGLDQAIPNKQPEKSAGKKKNPTSPAAPASIKATAALAGNAPVDISRVMIKVGTIKEVGKHPDADALYVEKIDLGEDGGPRTVVSGLVKHYPLEEMQNRRVLVVCNLKPAKMRGVESQGMVLCATGEDGKVEFVEPPEGVPNGERVLFPGYTDVAGIADPESPFMHPKKKMWEAVQVDLAVSGGVATYKGVPFGTTGGACRPRSVPSGEIR